MSIFLRNRENISEFEKETFLGSAYSVLSGTIEMSIA
jgi:hypothetical protein